MPAPPDPWRRFCVLLALLVGFPVAIGWWIARASFSLASALLGVRRGGSGRSWFDEIIFFRGIEMFTREAEPLPWYQWYIDGPQGLTVARQEGEFRDSMPTVGHPVRVEGRVQRGMFIIEYGHDERLGVRFTPRPSRFRTPALFLAGLFVVEILLFFSLAAMPPPH